MSNATEESAVDFPLPSLRKFMLPDQLVQVKSFAAPSLADLDQQVNSWVQQSNSIVAVPSPVSLIDNKYLLAVTYVPAAVGAENA